MDEFGYLSVLLSIIVGLAITQILQGFRGIVLSRSRVRMYWPTLVWAVLLLVLNVQSWWAMFTWRDLPSWTFLEFAVVLAQTVAQYLVAGIVFPDFPANETVDLRTHYYAHRRWFFGWLILSLVFSISKDLIINGRLPDHTNLAFQLSFILAAAIAALTQREWFHKALPLGSAVAIGAYIAVLFARLQ